MGQIRYIIAQGLCTLDQNSFFTVYSCTLPADQKIEFYQKFAAMSLHAELKIHVTTISISFYYESR